jgi:DNA polymerase-3 subunit epsilon
MTWMAPVWRSPGRRPEGARAWALGRLGTDGFVALDLETTGLHPRRDVTVALAAVPFVGGTPGEGYVTLVDPGRPIPPASTVIHGITDAMVRGAPRVGETLAPLDAVIARQVLVGHRLGFDLAVLGRACRAAHRPPLDNPAIDTMALAAALHPEWRSFGLDEVAARLDVGIAGRHTARGDAVAAGQLLLALLPAVAERGCRTVADLLWLQGTART